MIKTRVEIEKIRAASQIVADTLLYIEPYVVAGNTTQLLDTLCHQFIIERNAYPACLGYKGYPNSICTSVNHVVCHGIPSANKVLKTGDIINIDIAVIKDGYHGDSSMMYFVGGRDSCSIATQRLVDTAYECLLRGIRAIQAGKKLYHIAEAIQTYADMQGFSIVESFCGHGLGKNLHEAPQILHYLPTNKHELEYLDLTLEPGMVFTIEPILNQGKKKISILKDKWTAVTSDKSLSAQWEHTVLVTLSGCAVLSKRPDEQLI